MRDVRLVGADIYRSDLSDVDLTDAALTGASLVRTDLDGARLVRAALDGVHMGVVSMHGVDARQATFRASRIGGRIIGSSDFRGASLEDVHVVKASMKIKIDDLTDFAGMHGSMLSVMTHINGDQEHELAGAELQEFLRDRGADVEILEPAAPRPVRFYPPIDRLGQG